MKANPDHNPHRLHIGENLNLPGAETSTSESAGERGRHREVAAPSEDRHGRRRHGRERDEIQNAIDTQMETPTEDEGRGRHRRHGHAAAEEAPAPHSYVVKHGDTLYRIGKRFDVPLEQLRDMNDLNARGRLHAGQKVALPRQRRPSAGRTRPSRPRETLVRERPAAGAPPPTRHSSPIRVDGPVRLRPQAAVRAGPPASSTPPASSAGADGADALHVACRARCATPPAYTPATAGLYAAALSRRAPTPPAGAPSSKPRRGRPTPRSSRRAGASSPGRHAAACCRASGPSRAASAATASTSPPPDGTPVQAAASGRRGLCRRSGARLRQSGADQARGRLGHRVRPPVGHRGEDQGARFAGLGDRHGRLERRRRPAAAALRGPLCASSPAERARPIDPALVLPVGQ